MQEFIKKIIKFIKNFFAGPKVTDEKSDAGVPAETNNATDDVGVVNPPISKNPFDIVSEWLTLNVADWKETLNISASYNNDKLNIVSGTINWPSFKVGKECLGTIGILIYIEDKVYASTFEFFAGRTKVIPISKLTEQADTHLEGYGKLKSWQWEVGKKISVFYTANNIRARKSTIKERSNVVDVIRTK